MWRLKEVRLAIAIVLVATPKLKHGMMGGQRMQNGNSPWHS
jgi:hypothetical protein